jgi:hypothetical protein
LNEQKLECLVPHCLFSLWLWMDNRLWIAHWDSFVVKKFIEKTSSLVLTI